MKYPSLKQFIEENFEFEGNEDVSTIERSFEVISSCIDTIFTEEDMYI